MGSYIRTPYPELFADLPLDIIIADSHLRTPTKNVARNRRPWARIPTPHQTIEVRYGKKDIAKKDIISFLGEKIGVKPRVFDLPQLPQSPFHGRPRFDGFIPIIRACASTTSMIAARELPTLRSN